MKPSAWLFSAAMSVSCLALAQTAPKSQVTEITDPAKIADIERRAQELQASRGTTDQAQKPSMRSDKSKSKSKSKAKSKPVKKGKPPADAPMASEAKG